jgi:formylglycine-generating enzyme required for sulfatase activity
MAGNVCEWTRSIYQDYPYDPDDGRENLDSNDRRVLRGGSWRDYRRNARCACRRGSDPDLRLVNFGFRVVVFA